MAQLKPVITEEIKVDKQNPCGSVWHRWDPHIHAPGTLLNNQFKGDDPWEIFLANIEKSEPRIRALGITEYFSIALYEEVLKHKQDGRLPDVDLVFPNVELRFQIETSKKSAVNFHLLFSPDDPNHIDEIKSFLNHLTYRAYDEVFHCSDRDLTRLGHKHKPDCENDRQALEAGANQFKVTLRELQEQIEASKWFQQNALIAVAASSRDGTAGLQDDASFASTRIELEKMAHIIFSSTPSIIDFWLGKTKASKSQLLTKWNGCKPCLHGCDAHDNDNVGVAENNRYSWIKGDLSFDALRQAVIEPEGRAFVGEAPPLETMPSYTMSSVDIKNAPWLKTSYLPLNSGLITVIGARGSGKTALADLIAVGAGSDALKENKSSFVKRAEKLLKKEEVVLQWAEGGTSSNEASTFEDLDLWEESKVQYLSQQFVERLCSSDGLTDDLMREIERVIFEAHHPSDRAGASGFRDLLDIKSTGAISSREAYEQQIKELTEERNILLDKKANLPALKRSLEARKKTLEDDKKSRSALLGKTGDNAVTKRHQEITAASDKVRIKLNTVTRKHACLISLQEKYELLRDTQIPSLYRKMRQDYADAKLTDEQWENFKLGFKGNVEQLLPAAIKQAENEKNTLSGEEVACPEGENLKTPLIADDADLEIQTYNLLKAELERLQKIIGINQENALKIQKLSQKIANYENICKKFEEDIEEAEGAGDRLKEISQLRRDAYKGVFEALLKHEEILSELYKPLMDNLEKEEGSLGKLTFKVQRIADVKLWAERGEELLDCRKGDVFRGNGALEKIAQETLVPVWENGSADEIADAVANFLQEYEGAFKQHSKYERTDLEKYRGWMKDLSRWFYSTEHIEINYGVQYDGVNIQQLSPGTRGIVLLLLYLAVDKEDYRPLIIDQPEENLDPKSIFDELVPRFKAAKLRRQIIIVTHNANLVVNTDAEQVIVASCGPHKKGQLPDINYLSGGLENPEIREKVCEILEGGEEAFQERAKRLRVKFRS